jgi:hypothetical protein
MTDILERLAGPFIAEPAAQRVMDQAIEEIEHLREWNAEIALNAREFAAENERLRAALRDCLSWHDFSNDMHKPIEVRAAYMRARAALEGRT